MKKNLILSVLLGLLLFASCSKGAAEKPSWVAKINNKVISTKEFESYFDYYIKFRYQQQAALLKENKQIQRRALDDLVLLKLILKKPDLNKIVKPEYVKVFELKGLVRYFYKKSVQNQVKIPSEDLLKKMWENKKAEFEKRGVKDYQTARMIIVREYRKGRSQYVLRQALKDLAYKFKNSKNDELEEDAIKKYVTGKLPKADYAKTWLFKIEGKVYTAEMIHKFIKLNIEIDQGDKGAKAFEEGKVPANVLNAIVLEYFNTQLVQQEAKKENWYAKEEVKSFLSHFVDSSKRSLYLKEKMLPLLKAPADAEIKAVYEKYKKRFNRPLSMVKNLIAQRIFGQKLNMQVAKYSERVLRENTIEINNEYFKEDETEEKKDKEETKKK